MGMGMGLGLGLSVGVQDAKERFMQERKQELLERERREELERERERAALSEADAEASITFARRSGEGMTSSSEEDEAKVQVVRGGGPGLERGRELEVEASKGTPVNKGKAKATELDLEEGGDVQDADDADVEGDRDGDADPDTDTDSDYPTSHAHDTGAPPSIASRAHPHSELTGVASDGEDEAESEAWSSPVFAHTDSSDVAGSDGEASDVGGGAAGKGADAYRYGYRYGYRYESAEAARWGVAASEGTDVGHEAESVHEEEDRLEKEKANLERRKEKERARKVEEEKEREKEKAEWIVLDMGDDTAFSSFLRILHRHLTPPMASSFIASSPIFASPTPISTPTPTPTPTPFPSPISPRASGSSSLHFHWTGPSISDNDGNEESSYPPSSSHIRHSAEHLSPISTSSNSDRFRFEPPEHPSALAGLSHANVAAPKTFGVLPYPEWRTEVTQRAQRAGMGDVGRAMKWVLWQCGKQLDLDLEEVRNRDGVDEKVNADIRRKRRETLSLKHRRRSTTSRTSTITRGSKEKAQGAFGVFGDDAESASSATVDSEEESEAEWHGWMADLHRQHQAQAQQKREEEEERMRVAAEALAHAMHESEEEMLVPPKNVEEDRKQVRERRIRYEPSAVVTTMHSGAPTSFSTPSGTLYSASSSESLSRRQRAMSFSPVDRSSSPTGTSSHSHHGHNHSQSTSPLGNNHVIRKHPLPIGASLSHSTSMYATGLRTGANTTDPNLRRPSMPIITADQTFSLLQGAVITPHASILRSPIASNFSFPIPSHPPTQSPPFSPGLSSNFPGDDETPRASSSTQATVGPTGPATVPRRASSAGLVSLGGVGGSLGRSSSVLAQRRKKRTKEKEDKAKEKEEKAKEKERAKDLEREAKEARKLQRPKLSLATSSTHQLVQQPATSQVRSPTKTETGRSIMRRVKSGSSLNAGAILEEGRPASPTVDGGATTQGAKSKRAVFVHRLVRGLDSAMEFAEGK
ncbi:hypothetical protein FPV67DRAFT_1484819 [Lyophyllum atratum]|nr:hypothetical protein FPV67DRAFT_1484819 [Lyophyllum atratum]